MDRLMPSTCDSMIPRKLSNSSETVIQHRHANARMVENVSLIWLDNHINEETDIECQTIIAKLRSIVNSTKTFTDGRKCIEYINNIKNTKVFMIISGSLGQNIVPDVHFMSHVDSIFIFCGNKSLHELWIKEWPKIKGLYTILSPLCEALKQIIQQCEQNSISINYINSKDDALENNSDKINSSFLFTQIIKEIILNMNFEKTYFQQFIDYCRDIYVNNENELDNINMFGKRYYDTTPIWCYTHYYFLYSMLNRGLHLLDINIITKMSFFINDLHHQIEQLHKEQFNESNANSFTVYHGQGISKLIAEQMIKSKTGFISFNSFLCVSTDRKMSYNFAHRTISNPDLIGIFFVITIDPSKTTTRTAPFAFINSISEIDGKDEVLFSMHTVFCIREIQSIDENNRLFQVNLTLVNDNNEDFHAFLSHIQKQTFTEFKGWDRLGQLLIKMEQFDKAQQIYNILLEQTTNDKEKKSIYFYQLKKIKDYQISHKQATSTLHEQLTEIHEKTSLRAAWRKNLEFFKRKSDMNK